MFLGLTFQVWQIQIEGKEEFGNHLVVQWLELCAFTIKGPGSISGWGTKSHKPCGKKNKNKQTNKKKTKRERERELYLIRSEASLH